MPSDAALKSSPNATRNRFNESTCHKQRGAFTVTLPALEAADHVTMVRIVDAADRGAGVERAQLRVVDLARFPWPAMSTADGVVIGTTQIFGTAPRTQAFNVVLLAEGFTSPQQNDFNVACSAFVTALTATDRSAKSLMALNVFRVNVASNESGADDPVVRWRHRRLRNTYFDARFGANGLRRLLVCDDIDRAAGRAGAVAGILDRSDRRQLSDLRRQRRSGRPSTRWRQAPTKLRCMRWGTARSGSQTSMPYYAGGIEPITIITRRSSRRNRTSRSNSDRQTLKWNWAVGVATALPTMSNPDCASVDTRPSTGPAGTVGLFEGAHYFHCDAYRPEYDCRMQTLGVPFCSVCRQAIATRIAAPCSGNRTPSARSIRLRRSPPSQARLRSRDGRSTTAASPTFASIARRRR